MYNSLHDFAHKQNLSRLVLDKYTADSRPNYDIYYILSDWLWNIVIL